MASVFVGSSLRGSKDSDLTWSWEAQGRECLGLSSLEKLPFFWKRLPSPFTVGSTTCSGQLGMSVVPCPAMSILVCLIVSAPVVWVSPLWCGVQGSRVPA